jgi:hypothetical protein
MSNTERSNQMHVTVKINTHAAQTNRDGVFSSNIRPNVYFMDTVSKVVKSCYNGKFMWYVVEYGAGYSFVTSQDLVK